MPWLWLVGWSVDEGVGSVVGGAAPKEQKKFGLSTEADSLRKSKRGAKNSRRERGARKLEALFTKERLCKLILSLLLTTAFWNSALPISHPDTGIRVHR